MYKLRNCDTRIGSVETLVLFFAISQPKFTISTRAQEALHTIFRSVISHFVPEIFTIQLGSCPKFAPNFDVCGPPNFSVERRPNF